MVNALQKHLAKQNVCFLLATVAAALMIVFMAFWFAVPVKSDNEYDKSEPTELKQHALVDLNTADAAALCTLPGIGESKAKAIIAYREQEGHFVNVEDAANVSGVTLAIVESWQGQAYVSKKSTKIELEIMKPENAAA